MMAKNKIRDTEYEDLIEEVANANVEAIDASVPIAAALEMAAENAEPTDEAIRAAIRDEMARLIEEAPAPHEQTMLEPIEEDR